MHNLAMLVEARTLVAKRQEQLYGNLGVTQEISYKSSKKNLQNAKEALRDEIIKVYYK